MISSAIPKLPFIVKKETLDFYLKLGFGLVSDYGDYLILSSDEAELHFFVFAELIPAKSDFMIYLRIDNDIVGYYQRIQDLGIEIHSNGKLETKPWGQQEFSITDPNGTLLTFGQSSK